MRHASIIWAAVACLANCALGANTSLPQAIEVAPSEYWDGIDGPWSSFFIRVGTPEQDVRVLVSTASPESMVVLSQYGCSTSVFSSVPADCAASRGVLFNQNSSSTWRDAGDYSINGNGVGLEANLGYSATADFGLETLGIGLTGPSLANQTVAGVAAAEPFYMGLFGLNNQPVNYSSLGNLSAPSFLTTLKAQGRIPSLSWSYTAGARYRLKQVYGQLIFSGYDTSRFTQNSATFTMAGDITRDLVVSLQSISYSGAKSSTLLSSAIDIFIDSTDPNLWLPEEVCTAFENAFGISLDPATGLYLINETYRNTLLASNAEVSFRISDVSAGGDSVLITLPYAAFDLTAKYPLVPGNSSYYFPMKRAANSTQYTLGRTFLQEAYLSADYERKTFNVSACTWNQGASSNIVTITSPSDPASSGGSGGGGGASSSSSNNSSRLSGGAIAGITIGSVVGALLIAGAIATCILRKRRKWLAAGFAASGKPVEPSDSVMRQGVPIFRSHDHPDSLPASSVDGGTISNSQDVPMSAADVLAWTASHSHTGSSSGAGASSDSPFRSPNGTESKGGIGALGIPVPITAGEKDALDHGTALELDGADTHVRPSTELDGSEITADRFRSSTGHAPMRESAMHEIPESPNV